MRSASCVLSSRKTRLVATALTAAVFTVGVAGAAISAARAILQPSVKISVGSNLKILSANYEMSKASEVTIAAPRVQAIHVFTPKARYVAKPQEFIFSDEYRLELSAISKGSPPVAIERELHNLLSKRFNKLVAEGITELMAPAGISLANINEQEPMHEYSGVERTESGKLASLIASNGDVPVVHAPSKQIAKSTQSKPVAIQQTQPAAELAIVSSYANDIKVSPSETKPENLIAYNDTKPKLGYSDLVSLMLSPAEGETRADVSQPIAVAAPTRLNADVENKPSAARDDDETAELLNFATASPSTLEDAAQDNQPALDSQPNPRLNIQQMDTQGPAGPKDIAPPTQPANDNVVAPAGSIVINAGVIVNPKSENAATGAQGPQAPQGPAGPAAPGQTSGTNDEPKKEDTPTKEQSTHGMNALDASEALIPTPKPAIMFKGRVAEAFASDRRGVSNASVQILGTNVVVKTGDDGSFSFDDITVEGVLPVVIYKDGYLKRRIDIRPNRPAEVELVAKNSAALTAVAAGETLHTDGAFIFGQISANNGSAVDAMKVEVLGPGLVQPIYLDAKGFPKKEQAFTSSRGQFILLNVVPGTYLIKIKDAFGGERAPHIVHVDRNEGLVRRFSLGDSKFIRGKVLNATALNAPVKEAKVHLLGSDKTVQTNADGSFVLGPVYVDCSDINYLQVERTGFYLNRLDYNCDAKDASRSLYVFGMGHIDGVALDAGQTLDKNSGLVMGHTNYKASVKMQLWGPDELDATSAARGKDFYYDTDGIVKPELNRTTTNGNFTIFDAPDGLSYMQTFSADGRTQSFWPIVVSASTVNVYVQ